MFNYKQLAVIGLIALLIGGVGGVFFGRLVFPYLSSHISILSFLNRLVSSAPIVINRTEEVQLNEGVNLIDLIRQSGNFTVSIYDAKNTFLGNGMIVAADGLIFTSSLIVGKQSALTVVTNDGQKIPAIVKDRNPQEGLAVLSVQMTNLPVAQFEGAQDLKPGQRVIYMGRGNVKFEHLAMPGFVIQSLVNQINSAQISTDAVINSDYFGGPIVNLHGRVVGLVVDANRNIIAEDLQKFLTTYLTK